MSAAAQDQTRVAAYAEATRTVVGITSARLREDMPGATHLLMSYFETCRDLGLCHEAAWAVLFNASTQWIASTVTEIAGLHGTDAGDLLEQLAAQAAVWRAA